MSSNRLLHGAIRVHLTNVTGAGASQLLKSLLPALIKNKNIGISDVYLPDSGELSHFTSTLDGIKLLKYKRFVPKLLSRFLECTILAFKFNGATPLLVLGDIPLRVRSPQTLFVQTSHLLRPIGSKLRLGDFKYAVSRLIFRLNLKRVDAFIVQTDIMKEALIATYPLAQGRVYVISHPVPEWLLTCNFQRQPIPPIAERGLKLIYPSAGYPHKNHKMLNQIQKSKAEKWPVSELILTLDNAMNPALSIPWVHCVGFLSPVGLIEAYEKVDALLFLSNKESFGFPLLEAMFLGLPVVCPDLPYAHTLCGDEAIYFDPNSIESLEDALKKLKYLLIQDWKPDWSLSLSAIPENWNKVAANILDVTLNSKKSAIHYE